MPKKTISKIVLCLFFLSFIFSLFIIPNNHSNQAQAATATFQPATGSGGTSVDGSVAYDINWAYYPTWAMAHDAATANDVSASDTQIPIAIYDGWYSYCGLWRGIITFNTSSLTSNAVIDSATLGVYTYAKQNDIGLDDSKWGLSLVSANPASYNNIVANDYNYTNFGTTKFASDIGYSTIPIPGWNTFTLNASGLAAISKTGVSEFGIRFPADVANVAPGTGAWTWEIIRMYSADYGDHTTYAPTLTVTYHMPVVIPTLQTNAATGVTGTTATLNGNITATGGENASTRGFDYRVQGAGSWTSWTEAGSYGTGVFSHAISGLLYGTTYEFRAKATNSAGTGYGSTLTFTTDAPAINFSLSGSTTDFGNLSMIAIGTSSPDITLTVSTNALNGYTVYVKDQGSGATAGLYKASTSYLIPSSTATLSAGTEGYGIQVSTSGGTVSSPYNVSGDNVGALQLTFQSLGTSAGPTSGNHTYTVTHKAAISGTTQCGSYVDIITYMASGNF